MWAVMVPEGLLHHGQARGSPVQLAQVCQSGLLALQLACEPLYVWQPCMAQPLMHASPVLRLGIVPHCQALLMQLHAQFLIRHRKLLCSAAMLE